MKISNQPARAGLVLLCAVSVSVLSPLVADASGGADARCAGSVDFSELSELASAKCAARMTGVELADDVTLPIPDIGEWVSITIDTIDPGDAVEATVYRSETGELAAWINGDVAGSEEAVEAATEDGLDAFGEVESDDVIVPSAATVSNDGSPNSKCSTEADYVNLSGKFVGDINWYYNPSGEPAGTATSTYVARIRAALEAWEYFENSCDIEVGLPNLYTYYQGGTTEAHQVPSGNLCTTTTVPTKNVVGWSAWGPAGGRLAATCRWSSQRATVAFNSSYSWYTGVSLTGCSSKYDLGGLAVHEWGHALGLGHYTSYSQAMKPLHGTCETWGRHIGRGDLRGIRAMYGML